jgi:hypothetical protein
MMICYECPRQEHFFYYSDNQLQNRRPACRPFSGVAIAGAGGLVKPHIPVEDDLSAWDMNRFD